MATCPLQNACLDAANAARRPRVRRADTALGQTNEGYTRAPAFVRERKVGKARRGSRGMLSRRRSWWQGTTALSRSLQAGMRPTPSWIVALSFKEHSPPCLARCGTTHRLARSFRITTASCSSPPPSRLSTTTRPAKWSYRQDWLSHRMASTCTSSTTAATPRPISSSTRS